MVGSWSSGISVIIRRDTRVHSLSLLPPLSPIHACAEERPREDTARRQLAASEKESSPQSELAGTLILDFQPPKW